MNQCQKENFYVQEFCLYRDLVFFSLYRGDYRGTRECSATCVVGLNIDFGQSERKSNR